MLAEERFREILKIVKDKKTVTVQELTALLQTSESTIRRDLTTLHQRGALIKVHGGATTAESETMTRDADLSLRSTLNKEEKAVIGKYAAGLIREEDFVYLDAGSSVDVMIDYITESGALYVTNSVSHAQKLLKKSMRVFLIGGELKAVTEAIVGAEAVESLKKYHFTKGFFGTNGADAVSGYTTPDITEALVKEKAMQQCRKNYVLSDSSKINQISSVTFADFQSAQLITTKLQDESYKKYTNIMEV